jgi:hypothetical protein
MRTSLLALIVVCCASTANATPIRFNVEGVVTDVATISGETSPIAVGDLLSGWYEFDWDAVTDTAAGGTIQNHLFSYSVTIGSATSSSVHTGFVPTTIINGASVDELLNLDETPVTPTLPLGMEEFVLHLYDPTGTGAGLTPATMDFSRFTTGTFGFNGMPYQSPFNIHGTVVSTQVPEPSTLGLLAVGLIAVGRRARRRATAG